jgi:hypothetical protein
MITNVIGAYDRPIPTTTTHPSHSCSKHCANRTHRLRSSLKATHGRGREFKKPPVVPQDKIQDGQFVVYELYALSLSVTISLVSNSYSSKQSAPGLMHKNSYPSPPSQQMNPRPAPCATMRLDGSVAPSTGQRNSFHNVKCYTTLAASGPKTFWR